jgi:hypothetical protein
MHEGPDLGGSAPAGLRPLVHVNPPVLAWSARLARVHHQPTLRVDRQLNRARYDAGCVPGS